MPGEVWCNIAEKPSVAKEASRVLSNSRCRTVPSRSRFNPVFEFDLHVNNKDVRMLFSSIAGHLMEDTFPLWTKSWQSVPFQELFRAPVSKVVKEEFKPLEQNIEDLARRSTRIVLWLDCDREGENICFEVLSVAQRANPRLQVSRAHFSALTQRDLFRAVQNLGAPNKNASDAVDARQEMDLRIGAVFTRFQTLSFRDRFDVGSEKVISFGPCQFPTLGFVVRRQWEKEKFTSEKFYRMELRHAAVIFKWCRGNIYDLGAMMQLVDQMEDVEDKTARITRVENRPKHRYPPTPLATVEMQKLASSHLHLPSEQCMALAESLYQEGFVSYPRTETDSFTFADAELLEFAANLKPHPQIGEYATMLAENPEAKYQRPGSGGHNDQAHPPIHPTKLYNGPPGEPKTKLYVLIARHFLACMSKMAIAADTQVWCEYAKEEFQAGGQSILERNWLDVYPYVKWNNTTVPNYQFGQTFDPTEIEIKEGATEAPALLSEAQLIGMMDQFGIGTDATIAQHIKTVQERQYVVMENGVFKPTTLGTALIAAYEAIGLERLCQPELRAQMELAMADIVRGAAPKRDVVTAAIAMYEEMFGQVQANTNIMLEILAEMLPRNNGVRANAQIEVVHNNFSLCGRCRTLAQLVKMDDRWGLRCQQCNQVLRLTGANTEITVNGASCPLCNYAVLNVKNKEKQTTYAICPLCFTSPPPFAVGDIENAPVGDFRCFQCTAEGCPLASGSPPIGRCPTGCGNLIRLVKAKKAGTTGYFVGCKGFPQCSFTVYLPPCDSAKVTSEKCPDCREMMIVQLSFSGAQLIPMLDPQSSICLFCNEHIREYITIKGGGPPQPAVAPPMAAQQRQARPNRGQQQQAAVPAYQMPQVPQRGRGRGGRGRGGGGGGGTEVAPNCQCGKSARLCTSKQPKSVGRRFWGCQSRSCQFFEWIDN